MVDVGSDLIIAFSRRGCTMISGAEVVMGANDILALEANFKGWQEKRFPVPKKDLNVFEYYCID